MIPVVIATFPTFTTSLLPLSWYQRLYMISTLPPVFTGGSHIRTREVDVMLVKAKFIGAEGGPVIIIVM